MTPRNWSVTNLSHSEHGTFRTTVYSFRSACSSQPTPSPALPCTSQPCWESVGELTARTLGISLPQRVAWWELFDTSLDDIQVITHTMIALYKRQRIDWLPDVETPAVGSISSVSTLENSSLLSPTVEIQSLLWGREGEMRHRHPVPRSFPPMEVERKSEMPREDARDHLSDRSHSRDRSQHSSRHSHHSPHRSNHSHHSRHDRSRSHSHRHHHS